MLRWMFLKPWFLNTTVLENFDTQTGPKGLKHIAYRSLINANGVMVFVFFLDG